MNAIRNPGMPALKINGLGTVNVFLRWKLFCKDGHHFQVWEIQRTATELFL